MMWSITLTDTKPFSINKAHYRNGVRTRQNRQWALGVHEQLANNKSFIQFKKQAKKASYFHVHLQFNMPAQNFYTKKGKISRLTSDLSNIEKGLIDLIFDKRFHNRVEEGIRFVTLEVDDCLITRLISEKRAVSGESYSIDVTVHAFP